MALPRLALAFAGVGLLALLLPTEAHAWTPGTHIYLGESVLANLAYLPGAVADLQPANATMEPIYVRAKDFRDTQILGVVVGVYRRV